VSRRIDELGEIDLSDNIALKRYLDTLKVLCYDLYTEVSWSAEMLQQRLANVKGIKNTARARIVATALRGVAEAFKIAGGGVQKIDLLWSYPRLLLQRKQQNRNSQSSELLSKKNEI
jgi:hypothetical protein